MEMCYGSSDMRTAMTLLMFPLGSVILEHTMPKGSGLVWDRGVNNNTRGEAGGKLWLRESRSCGYTLPRHTHTHTHTSASQRIKV